MMEQASTANAKVSDSGYSNTCSNSQSQRSSDSSISRNSNRSESSGYCGRRPSAFESSNEAPPQPISKRKDKEHKKKKSKAVLAGSAVPDTKDGGQLPESGTYDVGGQAKPTNEGKLEEVADVELVDATDPGEHNGDTIADAVADPRRNNTLDDSTSQASEGFCAVISMHDGLVLYTTPTICTALGYPRDAWIGRSFINYVHPKDKATLAERITTGIASPQGDQPKGINGRRASLFCGLRKQTRCSNQQPSGQRSQARSNLYLPFHLSLSFRDFRDRADDEQQPRAMFLVVTAQPVHSAYKAAEEMIISSIFTTRHTATCHLSHVDPDVVQYFGYLPQDMVGRSLFEFYHPEDLPFIKDIYETVIRLKGGSFRSRPYRFGVQNGGYVVLETVWSSFINPWTKKLEFVVGQHRVLKGPLDPDVFRVPAATDCDRLAVISEEVLKEAKVIQGEIRALLHESVHRTSGIPEHEVSKRCKDLASFMESLLEEVKAPGHGRDALVPDERSFSEYDSLMLGVMSPHHEYCDSKSSTETPPSYNQLNYNENLERFFKSKPTVAMMYSSDEENVNSSNDDGKNSPAPVARKCMSPINGSGASGTGSAENLSSGSNNQASSGSRDETSNTATSNATNEGFKQPTLTESLLNRHNKDMEKLMMQKHRELRFSIKNSDKLKDSRIKATQKTTAAVSNQRFANQGHGVKRTGSHSWEGDSFKVSKHEEISRTSTAGQFPGDTTAALTNVGVDLRPPCAPPQNGTAQAIPRIPILPPMIPVYYVPVQPQTSNGCEISTPREKLGPPNPPPSSQPPHPSPYMFVPVSYLTTAMAGVIYPPVNGTPAQGMMYRPFQVPEPTAPTRGDTLHQFQEKFTGRKRPASQTTSVKAEPGNFMTMSESSTKVLSPGELFSSRVSNAGGCSIVTDAPTPKFHRQTESNGDESSSSSFYSSFLYRSSESSCNPDQKPYEYVAEEYEKSQRAMQRREPPWLEGVQLTPELIYEYQIHPKALNDVLQTDMDTLKNLNQPLLVNDQLGQLYLDLEVEGFEAKLVLEDGITSSGSDSGSSSGSWTGAGAQKQRRRMVKYGKLVMVHEENAPLPSPPPPPTQSVSCQQS